MAKAKKKYKKVTYVLELSEYEMEVLFTIVANCNTDDTWDNMADSGYVANRNDDTPFHIYETIAKALEREDY